MCSICATSKTLIDFYRDSTKEGGHRNDCKSCARSRNRKYNEVNRDKKIAYMRDYNAANRERINAFNKANYRANIEERRAYGRAYHYANRDKILAANKARRDANPEKFRTRELKYNEANREKRRAYGRVNDKKRRAEDLKYRSIRHAAYLRRRRMLDSAEQEPYIREEIFERDGWVCHLCDEVIDPGARWPDTKSVSIDHIVPLSLGGGDTPDNVRAAHYGCNAGRGAKPIA